MNIPKNRQLGETFEWWPGFTKPNLPTYLRKFKPFYEILTMKMLNKRGKTVFYPAGKAE